MKQGDTVAVQIQGINVGTAVVEKVEDGKVTLVIPAQRVVMGMRVSLSDETPTAQRDTTGTQTIIEGVDRSATAVGNQETVNTSDSTFSASFNSPQPVKPEEEEEQPVQASESPSETPEEKPALSSPVTITSADGRSYTLPPGTTMADLTEPAANE